MAGELHGEPLGHYLHHMEQWTGMLEPDQQWEEEEEAVQCLVLVHWWMSTQEEGPWPAVVHLTSCYGGCSAYAVAAPVVMAHPLEL